MKNNQYLLCKLCQSDQLKMVYTSRNTGLAIKHCESCGLFFVDKIFSVAEQQSIYQDESMYRSFVEGEGSVPAVNVRYKDWINDIQRQSFKGEYSKTAQKPRLLDIGCGAGDFLAVVREHGFEVYGFDPAA